MAKKEMSQPSFPVEKVSLSQGESQDLTDKEKEILKLSSEYGWTNKRIAKFLRCTVRTVQRHIKNIKSKGFIDISGSVASNKKSDNSRVPTGDSERRSVSGGKIRLHGMQFKVSILSKGGSYDKIILQSNVLFNDGFTVHLFKESLDIHVKKSYFGRDVHECTAAGFDDFNSYLHRLSHDLGCILIKPRSHNVSLVSAHFAEVGNELAKQANVNGDLIKVRSTDDGKVWFIIDNSFNLDEAETIHPVTSKPDMGGIVQPFFNDLRDNPSPLPSELTRVMIQTQEQMRALMAVQQTVLDFMKEQVRPPSRFNDSFNPKECDYFG